jgi:dTDP-4-amino-4,6-dideoxygalactose transaminase
MPVFEIPLTETTLDEQEVEAATRVLRSKWLTMGAEVAAFEREFAAAIGTRHAVAVSNGTTALEIAYRAAGVGPGDEVLIPAVTFIACFNAARQVGARPVLVDVTSEQDWTISVLDLAAKITDRTRLVVPMAHAGYPPDMEGILRWSLKRGLKVIEDACHGPMAEIAGTRVGAFGLAGTWSFFGNKNMTTGEGGMITTNDDDVAAFARLARSHGISRPTWDRAAGHAFDYDVEMVGTNARLDEVRAAIGRVQLGKLTTANAGRAAAAADLRARLQEIPGLVIPYAKHRGMSAHHLFCVLLPEGTDRRAVMTGMREQGIQTSIHYPPLHQFSSTARWFAEHGGAEHLPIAERIGPRILTLPLAPSQTAETNQRISEALATLLH